MPTSLQAPAQEIALRCRIAASAHLRASAETIGQWRREPVKTTAGVLPASLLKHSEDQTVLALRALVSAITDADWQQQSFADWGVVAAPNFFGRVAIARTIERLQKEGAWGISPHLIPHQSLHAVSGTISQALAIHGPNFGVGGGPHGGADAFLLATALLDMANLPGVWLLLTGSESEWVPGAPDEPPPPYQGVALALTSAGDAGAGRCLSIRHARPSVSPSALYADFQLSSFAEELTTGSGQWRLSDSHWLEIDAEDRT